MRAFAPQRPRASVADLRITVHRRTPRAGHLAAELTLRGAVRFADAELAAGRAVILEMGEESLIVRKGREIIGAIRKWLGRGKPVLTTITPMAGGQENAAAEIPLPPVLPYQRSDQPEAAAMAEPGRYGGDGLRRRLVSPTADVVAWNALVDRIGERAALGMLAGGGWAVRSTMWPGVLFVVTPEIIKIVNQGMHVSSICIVSRDGGSIWDVVLNRIQLLSSGADGEVQVFATGAFQRP